MSFLTALLGAAGGFEQGRQTRRDYELQRQRQSDTHQYEQSEIAAENARTGIDQQKQQQATEAITRNRGIDPTTGKPFALPQPLMQVVPNNRGKPATPQQLYDHYNQLARFYISTGQTDAANVAANQAGDIQRQMIQANTIEAQNARDIYNQGHMDQRTAQIIAGANSRNVLTTDTSRENNENTVQGADLRNVRTTDTSSANNERTVGAANARNAANVAQRYTAQSNNDLRSMEAQNAMATRAGKPTPYPNLETFKSGLGSAISQVTSDPKKLQSLLKAIDAHATEFGPQLIIYARRQLQDAARESQQNAQTKFVPVPGIGPPTNLPPPNIP